MIEASISRRGFIASAAVVAAGAMAAPLPSFALGAPVLYADGIHDDTDALEALLAGRTVTVMADGVVAETGQSGVRLLNGRFRTSRPVRADRSVPIYCGHCSFELQNGAASPHPFLELVG